MATRCSCVQAWTLPLSAGVAHGNPEDDLDNDNDDDNDDVAVRSSMVITAHQPSLTGKQQAHCNRGIDGVI